MINENYEKQILKALSTETLLVQTQTLVARERELTAQILHYLSEIQRRRLYSELGYSSLFVFCIKHLGFTESQTQRRIEAMRAINSMPEIESKIKTGALSLTAVAQAQSYFRQNEVPLDKRAAVFEKLENKSTRECEKALLELSSKQEPPKEKSRQITQTHIQITVSISNELYAKLEKVKNLLSHKNRNMTHAELLNEMADICLDKLNLQRSVRVMREKSDLTNSQRGASTAPQVVEKLNGVKGEVNLARLATAKTEIFGQSEKFCDDGRRRGSKDRRRYISIQTRRMVWQKYDGKCSYVGSAGTQCGSQFQVQVDHKTPLSLGGGDEIDNLRLLCASHNKWAAIEKLGARKMAKYLKTNLKNL
jgi:hypothetical protein